MSDGHFDSHAPGWDSGEPVYEYQGAGDQPVEFEDDQVPAVPFGAVLAGRLGDKARYGLFAVISVVLIGVGYSAFSAPPPKPERVAVAPVPFTSPSPFKLDTPTIPGVQSDLGAQVTKDRRTGKQVDTDSASAAAIAAAIAYGTSPAGETMSARTSRLARVFLPGKSMMPPVLTLPSGSAAGPVPPGRVLPVGWSAESNLDGVKLVQQSGSTLGYVVRLQLLLVHRAGSRVTAVYVAAPVGVVVEPDTKGVWSVRKLAPEAT